MMKTFLMTIAFLISTVVAFAEPLLLPPPEKTGGKPLMEVLNARQTTHQITAHAAPTLQQLSSLLWAANGVTRPDGKRTAPSARDHREIELAVLTAKGLFTYDPTANTLSLVEVCVSLDKTLGGASACVILWYKKSEKHTREYALVDAGFIGQNMYLFCTSKGWHTVFMGRFDLKSIGVALDCAEEEVLFAQRVGIQ
ncbi:MAG: nitroreductase family protein [Kiritimatiellia bacterium]